MIIATDGEKTMTNSTNHSLIKTLGKHNRRAPHEPDKGHETKHKTKTNITLNGKMECFSPMISQMSALMICSPLFLKFFFQDFIFK